MRRRSILLRAGLRAVAGAALFPAALHAHEYWLEPSRAAAVPGDTVVVRAFVGTGFRGELKPFSPARAVRLELFTDKTRDLVPLGVNGALVFARVVLPDDRGAVIAYESNFASIEMEGPKFDAYLAAEGLDEVLALRRRKGASGPAHEDYARCCKTWIAGRDVARVQKTFGMRHEIVPLGDPVRDARLGVRVLFDGKPHKNALVRAWNTTRVHQAADRDSVPPACEARTAKDGTVTLSVDRPGEWLVSTVYMRPSTETRGEWQSWWASLTFTRPQPAP